MTLPTSTNWFYDNTARYTPLHTLDITRDLIWYDIECNTAGRKLIKLCSEYDLTNDSPYIAFTSELWDVFNELFGEKLMRDIQSALYLQASILQSLRAAVPLYRRLTHTHAEQGDEETADDHRPKRQPDGWVEAETVKQRRAHVILE